MATLTNRLEEVLQNLSPNDREFGASLIESVRRRGLPTAKQEYWLAKLIERATSGQPERKKTAVGNLGGVMALFDKARQHLLHPKIVLGWRDGDGRINELRLSVAGDRARVPGSINVVNEADRSWYGRIHQDGAFEHSDRVPPPAEVVALLSRFAAAPAATATEHGRLTGKCCFCNSGLKDARSTAVGYGPTCAAHYDLPWGSTEAAASLPLEVAA